MSCLTTSGRVLPKRFFSCVSIRLSWSRRALGPAGSARAASGGGVGEGPRPALSRASMRASTRSVLGRSSERAKCQAWSGLTRQKGIACARHARINAPSQPLAASNTRAFRLFIESGNAASRLRLERISRCALSQRKVETLEAVRAVETCQPGADPGRAVDDAPLASARVKNVGQVFREIGAEMVSCHVYVRSMSACSPAHATAHTGQTNRPQPGPVDGFQPGSGDGLATGTIMTDSQQTGLALCQHKHAAHIAREFGRHKALRTTVAAPAPPGPALARLALHSNDSNVRAADGQERPILVAAGVTRPGYSATAGRTCAA